MRKGPGNNGVCLGQLDEACNLAPLVPKELVCLTSAPQMLLGKCVWT